jgi:hypothetical protein
MTTLVACLSVGKGTWQPVQDLISTGIFDKVILIASTFAKDNYPNKSGAEVIVLDPNLPLPDAVLFLERELKGKINDLEVGVNIVSGTGHEHMAVLAALLKSGVGIRLVSSANGSIVELDV